MMKVIGAGLPRTATTTQMFALEHLGFAPCYHMRDLLADLDTGIPLWESVADGAPDWPRIFGQAQSTLDWPAARFYRELADYYPESKVLLSVRDPEDWATSMRETVWGVYNGDSALHHLCDARAVVDQSWHDYLQLMRRILWQEPALAGDTSTLEALAAAGERWNEEVKRTVPSERLLVWEPSEGWEPLCDFLEVPVPERELPRLNDTRSFCEGIIGGALDVLNEWWGVRERPLSGLHGAALPAE
jgi:hypothetical protein